MKLLYEGKAKQIFEGSNEQTVIMHFKDDTTAFNGKRKALIPSKGIYNHQISDAIFQYLMQQGISTHWLKKLNERDHECKKLTMIPLEIIVRNRFAGSASKRLGINEGMKCHSVIYELSYKCDELDDPMINDTHVLALSILNQEQLDEMWKLTKRINQYLLGFFDEIDIELIDFKIEFGFDHEQNLVLGDEISPDCCRLWDKYSHLKLDKDRFRENLGCEVEAYIEICKRLEQKCEK